MIGNSKSVVYVGDCLDVMRGLDDCSVGAIITDAPYPEINKEYGVWTEEEWMELMTAATREFRRILKPNGSAVIVLQSNSEHVGIMRAWLPRYQVWAMQYWNVVQDVYWIRNNPIPSSHANEVYGLMRPAVKHCIWLGNPNCYRNQAAILSPESEANRKKRESGKASKSRIYKPSGQSTNDSRMVEKAAVRGGFVTPLNLLTIARTALDTFDGAKEHPCRTPYDLCDRWVRYVSRPGDTILDPFMGSGTVGLAALKNDRKFIGIERMPKYVDIATARIEAELGIESEHRIDTLSAA